MQVSTYETYAGVPITVRITISDADIAGEPQIPDIPGVSVLLVGGPNRSSQMTYINGRMTRTTSVTYDYRFTPREVGTFEIPEIEVEADGRVFKTQPVEISVVKSDTGDLLLVELVGKRESLYVGEPLEVTLRIWLRRYTDRQYNVKLDESHMWSRIDLQGSEWGIFAEELQSLLSRRQRPRGRKVLQPDASGVKREYFLYELDTVIWPQRPGRLDVGDIAILVEYPVRLQRDRFSVFGDLTLAETRPIVGEVDVQPIEVKSIPLQGRPPYFAGAVGRYEISASAVPTEVAVGEPITITLTVTGSGDLDTLQPPPLADMDELTRDFRVPRDPLAGEVRGNAKQFTQSIRARNDAVDEIPAVPFVYFDPRLEQFVTAQSDPIPIAVKPAERLAVSQIVDASRVDPVSQSLTEVTGGILANYTKPNELLRQQAFSPGWPTAAALGVPPVLFGLTWLVQSRRRRLRDNPSLARRRRARRSALSAIGAATGNRDSNAPAAIAAAVCRYVADRCDLPPGGLTRAEVAQLLAQRRVPRTTIDEIDGLLARCENLQYAPSVDAAADELARAARHGIQRLEQVRIR
jgi:hypothetical protein